MIAIILVAVIIASGLGYWLVVPKMPSQIATYTNPTTQETSHSTSSEETSTIPTSSVSVTSTTISSPTTLWINITAAKSVSYYLGLLQSNGTQPYVQLATELRKLPELTNATAVAKITYLALNATNPEVKEAREHDLDDQRDNPLTTFLLARRSHVEEYESPCRVGMGANRSSLIFAVEHYLNNLKADRRRAEFLAYPSRQPNACECRNPKE
jgi:hypothetical protein